MIEITKKSAEDLQAKFFISVHGQEYAIAEGIIFLVSVRNTTYLKKLQDDNAPESL